MTAEHTLSQSFDTGDFIAPDILQSVDAGVRASAFDITGQDGLADGSGQSFIVEAAAPVIPDVDIISGLPSLDPDEFMPYETPKTPEVTDFDFQKVWESASSPVPEKTEITADEKSRVLLEPYHVQEDIIVEIPEISPVNADLQKVQADTRQFDKGFREKARVYVFLAAIAAAVVILLIYLLKIL